MSCRAAPAVRPPRSSAGKTSGSSCAILGKIREERRTTFVLFEIEGLSGEEIARIQSVPLNTVWTRLYHARRDFAALATRFREAQRRMKGEA